MRASVLADAGPLYAAVDPEDTHHHRAIRDLEKLASERREILVAFPILLEAYSLVRYRFRPKIVFGWLKEMADAALVNPVPEDYRQAFVEVQRLGDQRITLFDATLAALAKRLGVEVWTYDHHFDVMRIPVWR